MMSAQTVHQILGRALTDGRFGEVLLRSPQEAIREFPFSDEERALIASIQAISLEDFARQLSERLANPGSGRRNGDENHR